MIRHFNCHMIKSTIVFKWEIKIMDEGEIKKIRLSLSLTQEEFAHRLGVTHGTVSRWETKRNIPSRLAEKQIRMLAALKTKKYK
jgi:DNA-binding transcriptional regulator YiaG